MPCISEGRIFSGPDSRRYRLVFLSPRNFLRLTVVIAPSATLHMLVQALGAVIPVSSDTATGSVSLSPFIRGFLKKGNDVLFFALALFMPLLA